MVPAFDRRYHQGRWSEVVAERDAERLHGHEQLSDYNKQRETGRIEIQNQNAEDEYARRRQQS
jgi:hypothetical protein